MSLLLLVLCCWLAGAAPALAQPAPDGALALEGRLGTVPAWSHVRTLSDPEHALLPAQAIAAIDRFTRPTGPAANLGRRYDTVWFHLPVRPQDDGTRWWLAIDYPSLDEVELFVVRDGRIVQRALMGDHLVLDDRPAPTRLLAAELKLESGQRHELLMRVRTTSSMIVPVSLMTANALVLSESHTQAVQGMLMGLGLALLAYTMICLVVYRDTMFLWFGFASLATMTFFAAYFGLAAQFLWPENAWLTRNAAPLLMLLLLASGTLFVERSLEMSLHSRRASLAMRTLATMVVIAALLFVGGAYGYRAATAVASYTGMLPMLIALPVAWRLARAGDRIARWTFIGWAVYSVGVVTLALLQGGSLPFSQLAHHSLQAGSVAEMVAWVVILAARADHIRRKAERAQREHDRLVAIAQTDPLTGLLNRRGLEKSMAHALPDAGGTTMAAIYVIDLDGFKGVNDTHGHDAGDSLLMQLAGRLRSALRAGDLVARTGGDEFIVVAAQLKGDKEAEQIGAKLLACCDAPFQLGTAVCQLGMSVGYALAPVDGEEPSALIKRADAAMYVAKQAGKRRVARATTIVAPLH
ncbi:MAG: GGDEF domain-containing protein [Burkholderiales bacterium]|nr:GGDEF domain-containing protein [Burkholderiales bacterium]